MSGRRGCSIRIGTQGGRRELRTSGEGDAGTAKGFWADNANKFRKHVRQLLKLQSVYRFPVKKASYPDLAEPTKFEEHETRCKTCEKQYRMYRSKDATLVTMMGSGGDDLTQVEIERKGWAGCGMNGWTSDNWRETGVFNVNNNLLVHLHV